MEYYFITFSPFAIPLLLDAYNKSELIEFISNKENCTRAEAEKSVNMFVNGITNAISEGNEVSLIGFGNFTVSKVEGRAGINPKTKESIQIEAYNQVRFKVGQKLKDACNSVNKGDDSKAKDKTKSLISKKTKNS